MDFAKRNLLQWGQCCLVRVACAEPGLPVSGRDMYEDWPEDLRALEEEEVEAEVEVVRVESGPPDTQGRIAATADADADSSDLEKKICKK